MQNEVERSRARPVPSIASARLPQNVCLILDCTEASAPARQGAVQAWQVDSPKIGPPSPSKGSLASCNHFLEEFR